MPVETSRRVPHVTWSTGFRSLMLHARPQFSCPFSGSHCCLGPHVSVGLDIDVYKCGSLVLEVFECVFRER